MFFTTSKLARTRSGWTVGTLSRIWVAVGLIGLAAGALQADDFSSAVENRFETAHGPAQLESSPETDSSLNRGELSLRRYEAPLSDVPTTFHTRDPVRLASVASTTDARGSDSPSESEKVHQRITARYENPVSVRFLQSLSADRGIRLYVEAGRLIDARHLQPVSYDARIRQAATNLWYAVKNQSFLETNGVRPSAGQVDAFREGLKQLILGSPIRTESDALNMLYGTMNLANRQVITKN